VAAEVARALRLVAARMADAVVLVDRDGIVRFANPAAGAMAGSDGAALVGRDVGSLVHPSDAPLIRAQLRDLVADAGGGGRTELRVRCAGLAWRHLEATATNLLDHAHVAGVLVTLRDVSERVDTVEAFRELATRDEGTGLLSRVGLRRALGSSAWDAGPVSLLFVDLRRLEAVLHTSGHDVHELVLAALAARVRVAHPGRPVARVGDRALVVALAAAPDAAAAVARELLGLLSAEVRHRDRAFVADPAIGVALVAGPHHVEDALRDAGAAARAAGPPGDAVVVFDPTLRRRLQERTDLELELRAALAERRLGLAYQPIVSLRDGRLVAAEALLRWSRRDGTPVAAAPTIELAEELGLIVPLGAWSIDEAMGASTGLTDVVLSVNLSARQLVEPGFAGGVRETLHRRGADPRRIAFEITETALITDGEVGERAVAELRSMGCRVGIDDFGTGWSSLARLHRLGIDFVKIDRSLVAELGSARSSEPVVAAVVAMARELGVTTVAEGVETDAQLGAVMDLGCDLAQGYLLGLPEPGAARFARR